MDGPVTRLNVAFAVDEHTCGPADVIRQRGHLRPDADVLVPHRTNVEALADVRAVLADTGRLDLAVPAIAGVLDALHAAGVR